MVDGLYLWLYKLVSYPLNNLDQYLNFLSNITLNQPSGEWI